MSELLALGLMTEVFVTLFVIMDPVGTVPIFLSLTGGRSKAAARPAARQAVDPKTKASDVPGSDYAGLRDGIAHQDFRVQQQIVEDTVRRDLPRLESAVRDQLG